MPERTEKRTKSQPTPTQSQNLSQPEESIPTQDMALSLPQIDYSSQTPPALPNQRTINSVLYLQRTIGNVAVRRMLADRGRSTHPPVTNHIQRGGPAPPAQETQEETEDNAYREQIESIQQTYLEHFDGFQTALDQLDVGALAVVAEMLQMDYMLMEQLEAQFAEQGMMRDADPSVWSAKSALAKVKKEFTMHLGRAVSLQQFQKAAVLGSYKINPEALADPILYLRTEMTYILRVVQSLNLLLNYASQDDLSSRDLLHIAQYFGEESGRPINVKFKVHVMIKLGVWKKLEEKRYKGRDAFEKGALSYIFKISSRAMDNSREFDNFTDVGKFDLSAAKDKLSKGWTDWAVTDEDAGSVFQMLASAPPTGRNAIIHKLKKIGKLDRLLDNLPWAQVKQLHDTSDDPQAQQWLRPYFEGKGGGKSLSSMYEDNIMENIEKGNKVRGYLWTWLKVSHNALTGGFADTYGEAYDLHEQGLISNDQFWATSGAALGRSAAVLAASIATGGAAGGFASGFGRGALGLSQGTAGVLGNVVGGAAANTAGLLTSDVMSMALLGQEGFSPGSSYLSGAFMGAGMGLVGSAGQLAPRTPKGFTAEEFAAVHPWRARLAQAGKTLRQSEQTTAQIYSTKHPWLHKLTQSAYARGQNVGKGPMGPAAPPVDTPESVTPDTPDTPAPGATEGEYTRLSQVGGLKATEGTRIQNANGNLGPESHPLTKHGPDKPLRIADGPDSLEQRLMNSPNMKMATKFVDRAQMETAIGQVIETHQGNIEAWLATNPQAGRNISFSNNPSMGNLGRGMWRNPKTGAVEIYPHQLENVRVVLKSDGRGGYVIQTAFPEPKFGL